MYYNYYYDILFYSVLFCSLSRWSLRDNKRLLIVSMGGCGRVCRSQEPTPAMLPKGTLRALSLPIWWLQPWKDTQFTDEYAIALFTGIVYITNIFPQILKCIWRNKNEKFGQCRGLIFAQMVHVHSQLQHHILRALNGLYQRYHCSMGSRCFQSEEVSGN